MSTVRDAAVADPARQTSYVPSVPKIAGIGTALVVANVALMFALSFVDPVVAVGSLVFGNLVTGLVFFAVTVGGGKFLASKGIEWESLPAAGAGVTTIQVGFGLLGATVLALLAGTTLRLVALAITAVLTAVVTAGAVVLVYTTDHSFRRWNWYSMGAFGVGIVSGVAFFFVAPALVVVSSIFFFLGFVLNLVYEIWAVKTNRYASDLRNAIGIYVAVMGVFVNILIWVVRLLSILEN